MKEEEHIRGYFTEYGFATATAKSYLIIKAVQVVKFAELNIFDDMTGSMNLFVLQKIVNELVNFFEEFLFLFLIRIKFNL